MGARSKRVAKVRTSTEFDMASVTSMSSPPLQASGSWTWTVQQIISARDAQMAGRFRVASRLAESTRTSAPLAVAYNNRLAPLKCLQVELLAAKSSPRAVAIANEAEGAFGQDGVSISPNTVRDLVGCFVNHGVAFFRNEWTPREDGTRVDCVVKSWPIEFVRWDPTDCVFKTQVRHGVEETIVHGDGRWGIVQEGELEPFKNGALLAIAMVWAMTEFAKRDWAKASVAHGSAKVIGEMPVGVALQKAGVPTDEGAAFLALLTAIATSDSPVGIRPAGSTTDFLTNTSTAWQVWTELVANGEKDAARIYLGTDGTMGSNGGAPGVDISVLFGVATTKVQGDVMAITRALATGTIEVWTAINFGDSTLVPRRVYILPDTDGDAARSSLAVRRAAFHTEIEKARANGFAVTQAYVDMTAKAYDVDSPQLPVEATKAPSIALAPTDIARVVSVNEARSSAGLGPLLGPGGVPDPDGLLTVMEFATKKAAGVAPPAQP